MDNQALKIDYTNYQGKRAWRFVKPLGISFKSTMHHPQAQWLMTVFDLEKNAVREFALTSVHQIVTPGDQELEEAGLQEASRGSTTLTS